MEALILVLKLDSSYSIRAEEGEKIVLLLAREMRYKYLASLLPFLKCFCEMDVYTIFLKVF